MNLLRENKADLTGSFRQYKHCTIETISAQYIDTKNVHLIAVQARLTLTAVPGTRTKHYNKMTTTFLHLNGIHLRRK